MVSCYTSGWGHFPKTPFGRSTISSTFKLKGTACFVEVGVGGGGGGSSPIWDMTLIVMKEVTISPHSLLLLLYHFTSLQGILTFLFTIVY